MKLSLTLRILHWTCPHRTSTGKNMLQTYKKLVGRNNDIHSVQCQRPNLHFKKKKKKCTQVHTYSKQITVQYVYRNGCTVAINATLLGPSATDYGFGLLVLFQFNPHLSRVILCGIAFRFLIICHSHVLLKHSGSFNPLWFEGLSCRRVGWSSFVW
jgi:hypothetical protein